MLGLTKTKESMEAIREIGHFGYSESQRRRFRSGVLWREWTRRYPELFDDQDERIARGQAHLGKHFFEWLGAILLFETTGYLSLVEKYEFVRHPRKQAIVKQLLPPQVLRLVRRRAGDGRSQCPDLLVYAPDLSDWYFCEIKGGSDRLRASQRAFFAKLASAAGRPVGLVTLQRRKMTAGVP
jgi:hypothetical protein